MADASAAVTTALDQTERAFQKQPNVFLGYKKLLTKKGGALRWTRNVGLGFKTPATAVKVRTPMMHEAIDEPLGQRRGFVSRARAARQAGTAKRRTIDSQLSTQH